jgi:hypothetical protein
MEPRSRAHDRRRSRRHQPHVDDQGPQVIGDRFRPLQSLAIYSAGGQELGGGLGQRGGLGARTERDSVVSRSHAAGQWGSAKPHVLELDQPPAIRKSPLEGLADAPCWPTLGQDQVDQLTFGRHLDGQRRTERDPGPGPGTLGPGDRKTGAIDRRFPRLSHLALGERRGLRVAGHDESPALAGLSKGGWLAVHVW